MYKFFEATKILGISKKKISIIIFTYLILATLELIGIGLFQSLIISIISPNLGNENFLISWINKIINLENAKILIIIFCLFFILKNIATMFFNYYLLTLFQKYHENLLNKFFSFIKSTNENNSELETDHVKQSQLITRYIDHFIKLFVLPCFKLINDLIIIIFIILFLMYLSFQIASFSLIYLILISLLFIYWTSGILKKNATFISVAEENLKKNIYEMINNFKEIFAYKIYDLLTEDFKNHVFNYTRAEKIYRFFNTISKQFLEISIVLIAGLFFLFLYNDIENLMSNMAIIGTFGFAMIKLVPSLSSIVSSVTSIKQSYYAVDKVRKIYAINTNSIDIKNNEYSKLNKNKIDKIEIKNLSFNYPKGKNILNNFNLNIKKGEMIGIQGPSGSGKTTLMDLILGLIKPKHGKIKFLDQSNQEIENFDNFAYISQNVSIFNESIAFNVGFKKDHLDKKKIDKIMQMVDLENLLNHKDIYNENIELDGRDLSGGQKQKIAIARSIYHDKEVILIDEATSNLDPESEKKFYEIIRKIKPNKIIFFISHKITNETMFDKIIKI